MAKNLTEQEKGIGHNSELSDEELDKVIRAHSAFMDGWEEKSRALAAEKKKANQEFKAETGMTIADFNAARRWAQIEDEGERDSKMSNMSRCFNALSVGGQFDWVTAAEEEDKK